MSGTASGEPPFLGLAEKKLSNILVDANPADHVLEEMLHRWCSIERSRQLLFWIELMRLLADAAPHLGMPALTDRIRNPAQQDMELGEDTRSLLGSGYSSRLGASPSDRVALDDAAHWAPPLIMVCHSRVSRVSSLTQSAGPASRSDAPRPHRPIGEGGPLSPLSFSLPPGGASSRFGESAREGPSDLEFSCGVIRTSAWSIIARLLVGLKSA
ncbi:hypothetical protein BHM03_00031264 [Ensete ventricosum]|nr:hypothetical protein BHM03_00031264 [Ensete ventricosum]